MANFSGADMRCPKCNKYMPDRCICNGPSIEERRTSPAAVPEGALPPLPKPKAPAYTYFSDEPVYCAAEVEKICRAAVEADRARIALLERQLKACQTVSNEHFDTILTLRAELDEAADRAQQGEPVAVYAARLPDDDDAKSLAVIEHLGPAALAGGKMSVYDAFNLGFDAGALHARAATKAAAPADAWTFDEWLKLEEATNGCMGLSPLERDQMRMAFNAARAAPVPDTGIPTAKQDEQEHVMPPFAAPAGQHSANCPDCHGTGQADSGGVHPWGAPAMIPCGCDDLRTAVARAIWSIRRSDEDRDDMELEDMGEDHSVWLEADAAIEAASGFREGRNTKPDGNDNSRAPFSTTPTSGEVEKVDLIERAAKICGSHCVCDDDEQEEMVNWLLRNRAAQIRMLLAAPSHPSEAKAGEGA